jgi:hypothetical protein
MEKQYTKKKKRGTKTNKREMGRTGKIVIYTDPPFLYVIHFLNVI